MVGLSDILGSSMMSGNRALGSIDETLRKVRGSIDAVENQMAAITERSLESQKALAGDYESLARVRLDRLDETGGNSRLDESEHQVVMFFEERKQAIGTLTTNIAEVVREQDNLERTRSSKAETLDNIASRIDDIEATVQTQLNETPAYREQRELAEAAERRAMHADDKASNSESERETKGDAYRTDPLFMYLWKRHYGTSQYEGSGLFRWLDSRVAKFVGYDDARLNYSRLNEIPARLREHANRLQSDAQAEFAKLRGLDEEAQAAAGIPALVDELKATQGAIDQIDSQIEQIEQRRKSLAEEKAGFATGDDSYTQRALEFLSREFQRADMRTLRSDALRTPYPDDDLIISSILTREHERQQLESGLEELRQTIRGHQDRLQELERLRADFKRQRFDRAGSVFGDGQMIGLLLGQFLNGLLDRRMLWKLLQEQQRYRPRRSNPTFGSGGFGRGTVWNGGIGDIPDIGDILGGGGGFGRGGGGGFGGRRRRPTLGGSGGGGGFRTGGGF